MPSHCHAWVADGAGAVREGDGPAALLGEVGDGGGLAVAVDVGHEMPRGGDPEFASQREVLPEQLVGRRRLDAAQVPGDVSNEALAVLGADAASDEGEGAEECELG